MSLASRTPLVELVHSIAQTKLVHLMVLTTMTLSSSPVEFSDSMATLLAVLPPASEVPEVLDSSEELALPMIASSSTMASFSMMASAEVDFLVKESSSTMASFSMMALPSDLHLLPVVLEEEDFYREVVPFSSMMIVPFLDKISSSEPLL